MDDTSSPSPGTEGGARRERVGATAAVGMDSGGTRTRVLVVTRGGETRLRREAPGAPVDPRDPVASARLLGDVLRELAEEGRVALPVASLCAGVAGADRERVRREMESALREAEVARRVRVRSDAEVALHDAHGDGDGLLLVAGTGSVAWGRDESGRTARAGGWGPILGDEGSGHAIARAALQRITRSADGREPTSSLSHGILDHLGLSQPQELVGWVADAGRARIAALAPLVVQMADDGVGPAEEIVRDAVEELVMAAEAVRRRLGPWPTTPELALAGGLLEPGGPLRDRVTEVLGALPVRIRTDPVDPVRGAAALALRAMDAPDPPPDPGG